MYITFLRINYATPIQLVITLITMQSWNYNDDRMHNIFCILYNSILICIPLINLNILFVSLQLPIVR